MTSPNFHFVNESNLLSFQIKSGDTIHTHNVIEVSEPTSAPILKEMYSMINSTGLQWGFIKKKTSLRQPSSFRFLGVDHNL